MTTKKQPSNARASDVSPIFTTDEGREIEMDSPAFLNWLEQHDSFRFEAGYGNEDSYRARKESYTGISYWYAFKKVKGKLHKRFIGKPDEVTHQRLKEIAKSIRQPSPSKQESQDKQEATPLAESAKPSEVEGLRADIDQLKAQMQEVLGALQVKREVTDNSSPVTEASESEVKQLHSEVKRLQNQLAEASANIESLRTENQVLKQELEEQRQIQSASGFPDIETFETVRDIVVSGWKVAKRAESKERIREAINRYFTTLKFYVTKMAEREREQKPDAIPATTATGQKPSWESKVESFLGEVSRG